MGKVLVVLVGVFASCATVSGRDEGPAEVVLVELSPGCDVEVGQRGGRKIPMYTVADCVRAAAETQVISAVTVPSDLSVRLASVQGSRDWGSIRSGVESKRALLRLCHRQWASGGEGRVELELSVAASGRVRYVRPREMNGLGQCIAKVLSAMELPPEGFSRTSTEALMSVSFYPQHETLMARARSD